MQGGVAYLEPCELLQELRENKGRVAVIDVRTDDFAGGHIMSASNMPVDEWEDDDFIESVLQSHISTNKKMIIFHCMYSQMRGPFCAKRYFAAMSRIYDDETEGLPEVKILRGGFTAWRQFCTNSLDNEEREQMILY